MTCKINFECKIIPMFRTYVDILYGPYATIKSSALYTVLIEFCKENNINIKKIVINKFTNRGFIKIKGKKEDYFSLFKFLTSPPLNEYIDVLNFK